jgi:hypothetical protein
MKKLVVILLMLAVAPVMAVEIGGIIDLNYFMPSTADTDDGGSSLEDYEINNSAFGEVSTALWATQELGEGLTGKIKLAMVEPLSNGADYLTAVAVEEAYVKKTGAFGQEALSFAFGKMEVPFNLDYDKGITHTFTNGNALYSSGMGEIDGVWALSVGYAVADVGTFTLSTLEYTGDVTLVDEEDEDSGLFQSIVLQWDTGADKDAFGVAGLRLVVAYAMLTSIDDADNGSVISLAGTYTGVENLTLALEIDMTNHVAEFVGGGYLDEKGGMLIALNADYQVNAEVSVGLSYEMFNYNEADDVLTMDASTDSRMALRASYAIADGTKLRFEYSAVSNSLSDLTEYDEDGDGDEDNAGYSLIALGVFAAF